MASVYLAEDNELPRQVALKLLPNQFIADKDLTERFFREARAAAKLEHPNIILIYEASVFEGQPFIAMQYIEGPTVAELISAKGKIEIEEAVSIICKVLETLEAAHKKGIFHRDIKPTNIMLKEGKYVRVIDFGIAKAATDSNLTAVGTAFGTPAYMAPEQFSASPDANAALYDVYAVGVTFYYMLCGKLPFEGDNPYAIRDLKIYKKPASPSTMASNIPPALDKVVMKAMAANPKDRYQSAQEMYDGVHNALKATQTAIIDIKEDPAIHRKPARSRRSKLIWMSAIIGGLTLLLGMTEMAFRLAGYFESKNLEKIESNSGAADTTNIGTVPLKLSTPRTLSPQNGSTITSNDQLELVWSSVAGDNVGYMLEYSTDENFSQAVRNANFGDTVYNPPTALVNGTYFWHVQARGNNGQESDFSTTATFVLNKPIVPPSPQEGIISITVNDTSSIYVDGKIVRAKAKSWEGIVKAGSHKVRVENQPSVEKKFEETVDVKAGKTIEREFTFTFASANAELVVATPYYTAKIFVDGIEYPEPTSTTVTLSPGDHLIMVRRIDNDSEMQKTVSVELGKKNKVTFEYDTKKITEE